MNEPLSTWAIETQRLGLRPLRASDLEDLATIFADPAVMHFIGGVRSRVETRRYLDSYIHHFETWGYGLWATIDKASGALIGRCGLVHQEVEGRTQLEVGYLLAKAYWGRGLATEAAIAIRDFGLTVSDRPLIAIVHVDNRASQRVATKIGMNRTRQLEWRGFPVFIYELDTARNFGGESVRTDG
ncbi:MAG: GNAT family N-acetyltransferase [Cyanobacteria bacterium J06639_1]